MTLRFVEPLGALEQQLIINICTQVQYLSWFPMKPAKLSVLLPLLFFFRGLLSLLVTRTNVICGRVSEKAPKLDLHEQRDHAAKNSLINSLARNTTNQQAVKPSQERIYSTHERGTRILGRMIASRFGNL